MKTICYSILKFSIFCVFLFIATQCSTNEPVIQPIVDQQKVQQSTSKNNPFLKSARTTCAIIGNRTVTPGTSGLYSYTYGNDVNTSGFPPNVTWSVIAARPAGSIVISGSGTSTTISFSSNFLMGRISVSGTGGGSSIPDCGDIANISRPPVFSCSASVVQVWCSPASSGYNAQINARVSVTNPFPNTASVLVQWNPNLLSGQLVAGGQYNVNANTTTILPTQFDINTQTSNPNGFYVPMFVRYTDLVTGATCTVDNLNPLVTGSCNGAPM